MTDVDLTEFTKLVKSKRKPCPVRAVLDALEPAERTKLEAALEAVDQVPPGAIAEWIRKRDLGSVSYGFVKSHRKRACRCGDD